MMGLMSHNSHSIQVKVNRASTSPKCTQRADDGLEHTNTSQFPNELEQNNTLPAGAPHEYVVAQVQLPRSRTAYASVYNSVPPMTAPSTFCITPELYGSANMFIYPPNVTNVEHEIFSPSTTSRASYDVPPRSPAPSGPHSNLPVNSHGLGPFESDMFDDESDEFY
jgi:hypothetical protein